MNHTAHNRQRNTADGLRTGSISTEEIKSRIAAMYGDRPTGTDGEK